MTLDVQAAQTRAQAFLTFIGAPAAVELNALQLSGSFIFVQRSSTMEQRVRIYKSLPIVEFIVGRYGSAESMRFRAQLSLEGVEIFVPELTVNMPSHRVSREQALDQVRSTMQDVVFIRSV